MSATPIATKNVYHQWLPPTMIASSNDCHQQWLSTIMIANSNDCHQQCLPPWDVDETAVWGPRAGIMLILLTPEYKYSYPKDQSCFNETFRKPRQFLIFIFPNVRPRFRTSGRDFERPAEILNVRPSFRTSSRDSECLDKIPHVGGLECWKTSHTIFAFLEFSAHWTGAWNGNNYTTNKGQPIFIFT